MGRDFLIRWVLAFLSPKPVIGFFHLPRFLREYRAYRRVSSEVVRFEDTYPCLFDRTAKTPFDPHYFYQGAWLARRLAEARPELHVDIGSSVLTIGVTSAATRTVFVDYRPLHVTLSGLDSVAGSITQLPFADGSLASLSCLHVIEHIGLGRYGDPLDVEGGIKAARELMRVLEPGGKLYLSLPVGRPRVCFNAHRVHDPAAVADIFPELRLMSFCCVDDQGYFHIESDPAAFRMLDYGCGMYCFEKSVGT
ncbi:MAG: DUF268 domain-containing protein [Gammaproteobacteria bacterium]|nr:DUF268 domain-containing protein [Gammaproteobacteria bacterium]